MWFHFISYTLKLRLIEVIHLSPSLPPEILNLGPGVLEDCGSELLKMQLYLQ